MPSSLSPRGRFPRLTALELAQEHDGTRHVVRLEGVEVCAFTRTEEGPGRVRYVLDVTGREGAMGPHYRRVAPTRGPR